LPSTSRSWSTSRSTTTSTSDTARPFIDRSSGAVSDLRRSVAPRPRDRNLSR
jgi:hypothetical protein